MSGKSFRITTAATLAALFCVGLPCVAQAAPPARLGVDTSAMGDAGPVVKRRLEERGATILRELDVADPGSTGGAVLSLTVREFGGDAPGFELTAALIADGSEVAGTSAVVVCSLCTEGELVERAEVELRKLVASLETYDKTKAPADPTGPEGPADPQVQGAQGDRLPRASRAGLGRMGWSGVALAAGGGAGLIAGGIMAALPAKPLASDPTQERYTSTAGLVTMGVGGALLVTGAALIGIDVARRRKERSASRPHLGVAFSRSEASVALDLRF